jgi:regulation of enolase protein 1 (concanavalin A-like superfamily)
MQFIRNAIFIILALAATQTAPAAVSFSYSVVEPQQVFNGHKPKVIADFGLTGQAGIGIYFANQGFRLYRHPNFTSFLITPYQQGANDEDARVADLNGDGAPDIVIGGSSGSYWLENPLRSGKDPYSSTWTLHHIDASHTSHDVLTGDINGDGKIDIATESGVYLQGSNADQWTFVGLTQIRRGYQGTSLENVTGDGFLDIIAPDPGGTRLSWFENPLHNGGNPVTDNWTEHIIDPSPGFAGDMTSAAFDVNRDGHLDVLMTPMYNDGNLSWYEAPADPRSSLWKKHVIAQAHYVHQGSLQIGDFDGDGLLDIAFAEQEQSAQKRIGIFFNQGSGATWTLQVLAVTGGHNLKAGLIGNDRYPSLLCANHGYYGAPTPVELWRNQTQAAVPAPPPPPTPPAPPAPPVPPAPAGPVSDEFTALDSSLWTFENPVGDGTVRVVEKRAAMISLPGGVPHDLWFRNNAARLVQSVGNVDFAVEVKFDSSVKQRYQMQGIVVEQDNSNYIRFETYSDGSSVHVFAATFASDQPSVQADSQIPPPSGSTWLRIRRAGNLWSFDWSADGVSFTYGASFNYPLTVSRIGPHAGNNNDTGASPPLNLLVDYFRAQ